MHAHRRFIPAFLAKTAGVLLLLLMASADAQAVSLRWASTYNGASNGYDGGYGVAVAPDGSIYVTGYTDVAGQQYNLLLQKYR